MSKSDLTISLNEILFYFTRAAFGVNVPIGLSEDFAYSNIWIAENGFDPSLCSLEALNNLDNQVSSLAIKFEKLNESGHFFCHEDKFLSALEASVSVVDWIEVSTPTDELKISNVDAPFLVVSAIGANQCSGLTVSWVDQDKSQYQVNFIDNETWEIISSSVNPIELTSGADMLITSFDANDNIPQGSNIKKFNVTKATLKTLNNGVQVRENWQGIYDYFSGCLVKSSAESRASGAGAGMVDTD